MGANEGSSSGDRTSHLLDPTELDPFALDELNRRGPKYGIILPQNSAYAILSRVGEEDLESYKVSSLGYNNRIYFVTAKSGAEYVIKICGRYWKRVKTETEVVGLFLAGTLSSVPAPRILAWDSKGEEFGVEYTVMRKLEGIRLQDVWNDLSFEKKQNVVGQLAELVVSYRSRTEPLAASLPQGKIGNFMIRGGPRCQSGEMDTVDFDVGPTLEGLGPWWSYNAYLKTQLEVKMESVRKDPRMKAMKALLPKVEALLETLETGDEIRDSVQFVFTHGDLNIQNLLVTYINDLPKITAVLDWEWSGMFPAEEEFFCSFEFIMDEAADGTNEREQLQSHFFDILEDAGVDTPRTLPYYWQRKYLYDLRETLFPWQIQDCDDVDKAIEKAVADVHHLLLKLRT
ncbi:unnamed protein product [Calypogeia fissa]